MRSKLYADKTLQLRVPVVLNEGLERAAEKQHTTKSEIVRRLIVEELRRLEAA
jgi:predicted DNA-binding protein